MNRTILKNILIKQSKESVLNKMKELENIKEVDKIIELYLNGKGIVYISKNVGITRWRVEGLLTRLGYIEA
ncbi:hypothetical protein AABC03_01000 [Staphylococcus nepalensis]